MNPKAENRDEHGADVERYEQLRAVALAGDPGGWRCGLGVVQRRGAAAWLHAGHAVPATAPSAPARETTVAAPAPGVADRLVEALAAMALAVVAGR